MRKSNHGGVAAEVAVVVGMALIVVVAAVLLVTMGIKWLTDDRQKPMVVTLDDNGDDSDGAPSDLTELENEDEQSVAEPPIQADTGRFADSRDGKKYRYAKIDGKMWMAENLNYKTSMGSWCNQNDASYCNQHGRLYDWFAARTVCPSGWHLPTSQEWDSLGTAAGGEKRSDADGIFHWKGAGDKLKTKHGWNEERKGLLVIRRRGSETYITEDSGKTGNGTDDFGFSALPSNSRFPTGDFFFDFTGDWWTSTEYSDEYANHIYIHNDSADLFERKSPKLYGFSVRCASNN
jgi:uncharacterized protein (TIGR02145 family)